MTRTPRLIAWAKTEGVFTLIDRKSPWGNPFVMPDDGDRVTVIDKYRDHLTRHPEVLADVAGLAGRVLGCWCAPQACHGHVLAEHADPRGHPDLGGLHTRETRLSPENPAARRGDR